MSEGVHRSPHAPQPAVDESPKFQVGDRVKVPTHGGHFVAEVVKVYESLEDAEKRYEKSFRTILQAPYGKPDPDQPFYYCEVANKERKPVGVAEKHAELKWRPPEEGSEG